MTIARRGFTLLEILLATILSAVLLTTLWSLFGQFSHLLTHGQVQAVRAQLIRSLTQQMTDDLRGSIQDASDAGSGGSMVRRFRLMGSAHVLQVDVLEAADIQQQRRAATVVVSDSGDLGLGSQALELRTVRYIFVPPQFDENGKPLPLDPANPLSQSGLVRQELDFQPPSTAASPDATTLAATGVAATDFQSGTADGTAAGDMAASPGTSGYGPPGALDAPPADLAQITLPGPDDDTTSWVPEVMSAEFRYFDGYLWSSNWDSLQRGSLPVAVEIRLQILAPGETPRPPTSTDAIASTASSDADAPSTDVSSAPLIGTTYRVVVDMPRAILHPQTSTSDMSDEAWMDMLDAFSNDVPPAGNDTSDQFMTDENGNIVPVMPLPGMSPPASPFGSNLTGFGGRNNGSVDSGVNGNGVTSGGLYRVGPDQGLRGVP